MVVKLIRKGNGITTEQINPKIARVFTVKKPLTPKEMKVVAGVKMGATKKSILKEAGYGKSTQRKPERVFDRPQIKEAIAPIVDRIIKNRERIVAALEQKDFTKQSPFNLTAMMNMHTKDAELLSGRPTSREEYVLPDEERERLDELLRLNRK